MTTALTPLVGLFFAGATLTEHDEIPLGAALVGKPTWSRSELQRDLELRLGLAAPDASEGVRVQRFARRMAEVLVESPGAFYARSSALDPLGTATTVLAWRDELVACGWNGERVPNGGARLDALHAIEAGLTLPAGRADRLRLIEEELLATRAPPFDAIVLAESRALWPGRWQRIFARLEEMGTPVRVVEAAFECAPGDSDLARLQADLRGDVAANARALRGDGSIVILRAETSWELADATAALLRACDDGRCAILRGGEAHALDAALVTHGLASQGLDSVSPWRPALQVLPLAVELAYEPRDPYRVFELLTLSVGPLQGVAGQELAESLSSSPGIGGPRWLEAKTKVAERTHARALEDAKKRGADDAAAAREADAKVAERAQRIFDWLEAPGCDAIEKAPRASLLAVAKRVRAWLQKRLVFARKSADESDDDPSVATRAGILGAAYAQAQAFHEALSHDSREGLDLIEARLLLGQVALGGRGVTLAIEAEGRIDPVDSPSALRAARDVVVWWHCVGGTEWRPPVRPWRSAELAALQEAGVVVPDPAARLQAEARSWHQVILATRKRLVLAIPRWALGVPMDPHPIFHEIAARLGADETALARITVDARDLLAGRCASLGDARPPAIADAGPLAFPKAQGEWRLDPARVGAGLGVRVKHSASSLDALVGCPLKFVLSYRAGLRDRPAASIIAGPRLYGTLGHRLVEKLHNAGELATSATFGLAIAARFETLLREEGAVLLRPGMTFELRQLRSQIARSVQRLAEILAQSKLTVAGVEVEIDESWRAGWLTGWIDLLLRDEKGDEVIVDLKWGKSKYAEALENGRATQLAVYVAARRLSRNARQLPPAAYFSLARGDLLATDQGAFAGANVAAIDGPPLAETWTKLERTVAKVEETLATGHVPVTGLRRSLPLAEALGVSAEERERYLQPKQDAPCEYCAYDAICGRRWESVS